MLAFAPGLPNAYDVALTFFDELKQSVRDIEFLSEATTGEVRVGCMEGPWFTLLPDVILRFSKQYPRIAVHAHLIDHSEVFRGLRERRFDCVLMRVKAGHDEPADDLTVKILFAGAGTIAAGAHSKWARRRKIDLAELIDEPWILAGPTSWNHPMEERIFRARGLSTPKPMVTTDSIILSARLVAGGPYLSLFSTSALRRLIADSYALTALPVDLPESGSSGPPSGLAIVTLKHRTLSPVVERFLACVRELADKQRGRAARSWKSKVS
jgi:DNA-binding transcriptional LysR family regulator